MLPYTLLSSAGYCAELGDTMVDTFAVLTLTTLLALAVLVVGWDPREDDADVSGGGSRV